MATKLNNKNMEKTLGKTEVVNIINDSITKNNNFLLQQIQSLLNGQKSEDEPEIAKVEKKENYKRSNIEYDSERLVSVQNISIGLANYDDGRSPILFTKPFATRKFRWSKLKDFIDYGNNKSVFENGNLVILDEDVRIIEGLQEAYEERGATEKDFQNMLKLKTNDLIAKLEKLKNRALENELIRVNDLRMVFLDFFLKEYNNGNSDVVIPEKFAKVDSYYKKEFGIESISQIALTMKEGCEVWKI